MGCTIHVVCTLHGFMLYLLVYSVLGFAVTFPSSHLFDFSQKQECVALTHKKNQEMFQFLLRILKSLSK